MADTLNVRVYNVRFGDGILITVPDRNPNTGTVTARRILIDVGNAPLVASPEGGDDSVFKPVIDDILDQLGGDPVDLYVMTHEHLDHVQGLPYAAWKLYPNDFANRFRVSHVWLTASAAPDYYQRFPNAKRKKLEFEAMHRRLKGLLAHRGLTGWPGVLKILANNDPSKTTPCVEFLRNLNPAHTAYIHREAVLDGTHPFEEARFEIWAPEKDTSDYYGRFQPLAFDEGPAAAGAPPRAPALPPPGVDVGAFLNLVAARHRGIADNLLAIDKAANNTSVVFTLEWRGWVLLFAADAEHRSWLTMQREGVLKQVHFLKVSHHGSHTGTPEDEIFDTILPPEEPEDRNRISAVSTWTDTYPGIPHPPTDQRIISRCGVLHSTLDDPDALYFDLEFPG
jgi:hypothetical protein